MVRLIPDSEPAPTIGVESESRDRWLIDKRVSEGYDNIPRATDEPAPTLNSHTRQSTTVAGDPRLGSPGHRDREGGERQFQPEAVQVTVTEAAILQSFPPDYPWQGSRTAKFTQIGNAIPPLLARAILAALLEDAS
jgi:DNA (cytosine-5)-methyltransferase 1